MSDNKYSLKILNKLDGETRNPCLICVFNYAKDENNLDLNNHDINYEPFFLRLNSKVLAYNSDITEILDLVGLNLSNNILSMNILELQVIFVVHPDRLKSYKELINSDVRPYTAYNFKLSFEKLKVTIITYEQFFSKVDGYTNDGLYDYAHRGFLSTLSNAVFIFEDINWFTLSTKFKYSLINLSGGSNTKRQFLSILEFKLSQFVIGISLLNVINNRDYDNAYYLSKLGNDVIQLKKLNKFKKRNKYLYMKNIVNVLKSYHDLYQMNVKEIIKNDELDLNNVDNMLKVREFTRLEVIRKTPGYRIIALKPVRD